MSLSLVPQAVVSVYDKRLDLTNQRYYVALEGGADIIYKSFTANSASPSGLSFSCNPPAANCCIDKKPWLYAPCRATIVGLAPVGVPLLNIGRFSPRSYPLASSMSSLRATINGDNYNIDLYQIIQPMMHFNTGLKHKNQCYSMTPTYPDQSQQYSDLYESIRSPLGTYSDSNDIGVCGRGGYPFVIVSNPVSTNATVPITAIVDFPFCENLYLSPLTWGNCTESGLYNVTTFDVNIQWVNNLGNRMISHDAGDGVTIQSIQMGFSSTTSGNSGPTSFTNGYGNVPQLMFTYIMPKVLQPGLGPMVPITWPYFRPQFFSTTGGSLTAGSTTTLVSESWQLSSIPNRIYIFARESDFYLYSTPDKTDTYLQITNLSMQFIGKSGIFASASPQALYEMSLRNGISMSFNQWSGLPMYTNQFPVNGVSSPAPVYGIGTIICIESGTDLPLAELQVGGASAGGTIQVQFNVQATNLKNYTLQGISLCMIAVYEGTATIPQLGQMQHNESVLTSQDVLFARSKPEISYAAVENVTGGGNFFSDVGKFISNAHNYIKDKKILSSLLTGLSFAPIPLVGPAASVLAPAARLLGYGDKGGSGVLVGGKRLTPAQIRNRLKK